MSLMCFNGALVQHQNVKPRNGSFETMLHVNNSIPLLNAHMLRLTASMQVLNINLPSSFTASYINNKITALTKANGLTSARIKLSAFTDHQNKFCYTISCDAAPDKLVEFNIEGWKLCVYNDAFTTYTPSSFIKKNLRGLYDSAAAFAKQHTYNDAVLLNNKNHIAETAIGNIFLCKDRILYTPALTAGCVAGIMRNLVIDLATTNNIEVRQTTLLTQHLYDADEIFITNALRGIRWVSQCANKSYTKFIMASSLHKMLLQKLQLHG